MISEKLKSETEYIFNRNWEEDLPEEREYECSDKAAALIAEYGWPSVFEAWNSYLHEKCDTPYSVINFAHLYWQYSGEDYPIPEPHKFLGYMLYKLNCKTYKYEDGDIIESLATNILPKAGYREADLYHNPYYNVDKDKKLLAAAEYWKQQNENH